MERFSVSTPTTGVASGTNKTLVNVYDGAATPTRRGAIYDLLVSSAATPADQAAQFLLQRTTANGTATAYTPNNLDPGGVAGELSAGVNHSAEPTYTSAKELLKFSLNQRATFRWVAAPGSELLIGTTQNNGIGMKTLSSTSTQNSDATVLFCE